MNTSANRRDWQPRSRRNGKRLVALVLDHADSRFVALNRADIILQRGAVISAYGATVRDIRRTAGCVENIFRDFGYRLDRCGDLS